jgi:hypothetical protein
MRIPPPRRTRSWLAAILVMGLAGPVLAADAEDDAEEDDEDEEEAVPTAPCARLAYDDGPVELPGGLRIERDGTCVVAGGEARIGHAWQQTKGGGGLVGVLSPGGAPLPLNRAFFFFGAVKLEAHRFTDAGRFGIVTELGWQTVENDGLDRGLLQLRQAYVRAGGLRAGFGDSYATFAQPAILAAAFAPKRAVAFAGYELTLGESTRLAVAVESGPALGPVQSRFVPVETGRNPFLVGRVQHDLETAEFHLAGVVTKRQVLGAGSQRKEVVGHAWTAGLRADLPESLGDHEINLQATAAWNAVAYLGGALDVGTLGARFAGVAEARGASALASYTRRWTPAWSSTFFASGIRAEAPNLAGLRSETLRYGGNLVWQATPHLRIGFEVSRENTVLRTKPLLSGIGAGLTQRSNGTTVTAGFIAAF